MASINPSERVEQLLTQAHECLQAGDLSKAFAVLKEASQLEPENTRVKEAWETLQAREQGGEFLLHLRTYLENEDHAVGQRAVEALKQRPVPPSEATEALDMLLSARREPDLVDTLTGLLLAQSLDAGKALSSRFLDNATAFFRQVYPKGEDTFRAFAAAPFNDALWDSRESQRQAQVDLFRLSAAKLMDADVTRPERCMRYIARQMAVAPETVRQIIDDEDVFDVILSSLDIRLEATLRVQATLATAKILEITKDDAEKMFGQFLTAKVARQINDDLIVAFSAAAAVFPIIPAVAARLFLTEGFVAQLVPNLERNSEAAAAGQRKSKTLERAALELLSAACVDKACRESISKYCSPWLHDLTEEQNGSHMGIAALVLAKINAATEDDITSKLVELVISDDGEPDQAVEGLAYTSLRPKIKEEIAANEKLLASLITALKERQGASFGCLTIISNLTTYRPVQSEEQKKMAQLKAYANQSKPEPEDPLDDDTHVTARASKLIGADVVPALVACCKQTTSPANVALVVLILLSLSKEQKHRAQMTKEGAVRLLLQIRDRIAKTDKSSSEASVIERNAAHGLARLLISVNPSHVFSASLPATSAVSALLPMLSHQQDSGPRNLLPTFESLLALTNLASMEDSAVRDLQIRSAWEQIEELMFSSNTLVQRASVELVCNLVASPEAVAKFADGSPAARRRMHILLAMADVEDAATRRAAGGALAMLTEWDAAVTAVLDRGEKGLDVVLAMCADGDDAMRHRGFACLLNMVSAPGQAGPRAVEVLKEGDRTSGLKDALRKTKNAEILSLGVEVLKAIA